VLGLVERVVHGSEDRGDTLSYCDPPFMSHTRAHKCLYGVYEMSAADHRRLLTLLRSFRGRVVLSGYPSSLYAALLSDWHPEPRDVRVFARWGEDIERRYKTEAIWTNFIR
jgi:DNA adenine methylase